MFLFELIILLVIVSISSLKITMRRRTDNDSWGEPVITILQIAGIILLIFVIAAEKTMMGV